jgi:hypothetical protein
VRPGCSCCGPEHRLKVIGVAEDSGMGWRERQARFATRRGIESQQVRWASRGFFCDQIVWMRRLSLMLTERSALRRLGSRRTSR